MQGEPTYEVIIIGGSHAGLSAALTLGRCRRETLVLDHGRPCNMASPVAHNFSGGDGISPQALTNRAKDELLAYPSVTFLNRKVNAIAGSDGEFEVITDNGESFTAAKILMATGVVDILPEIPGMQECWGKTAIHCPYCHGFEIKDQKLGILAHGLPALEMSRLMLSWTDQITILSNEHEDIGFDQRRIFRENGIRLEERIVSELRHEDGQLQSVVFEDGASENFEALYIRPGVKQPGRLAIDIGLEFDSHGFIKIDHAMRSNVSGVYAAGDCCNPTRSIAQAVGMGNKAGMCINHDLLKMPETDTFIDYTINHSDL